ncbi:hypothetical protein [Streptomyces sp. NPDC055036]
MTFDPTAYILLALMESAHVSREDAQGILAKHDAVQRAKAIEAARGEYLCEQTGTSEDEAYNQAVDDVVAAIGALNESEK